MHPEYPSQAAIIAGVCMGVFEAVFGANRDAGRGNRPGRSKLQRSFANVKLLSDEVQDVRVWGGIHFRNSLEVGYDIGLKIADFLVKNSLKPTG